MKAITGEVEALLDGLDEGPRRSGALLASELIAQVVAPSRGWNSQPVDLTIQVRKGAIRLEATGPVAPLVEATAGHGVAPDDPFADWGPSRSKGWLIAGASAEVPDETSGPRSRLQRKRTNTGDSGRKGGFLPIGRRAAG